ncbi:MAG: PaaI family thioesterase [Candidatus Auribacterota bacterium]|jgi:uncharacterized protein (TIGR00369 family)|nr:PaaI family thioesterase [Candidatus Auribacterota bacterium]
MKRKLPSFDCCFCCSGVNPKGLRAQFHVEGNKITGSYQAPPEYCGYPGITHGGITATLLDEAMTWAATVYKNTFHYAGEIKVRYRRPVPTDSEIIITAYVSDIMKKIVVTAGQIETSNGTILACAEGKYYPMSEEQDTAIKQNMRGDVAFFDSGQQ